MAHALMISTWWIGPLIILIIKRSSRFISFHALQALFWQIIFTLLYVCATASKAMRGEWAGYPVIGRWAERIVRN